MRLLGVPDEPVYVLVMRYHREGDPNFTRCGRWIGLSHTQTRESAEAEGFTYCRRCFPEEPK